MKKLTPLALSLSLALGALHGAARADATYPRVDEGLAAGLDMMLINTSLLRNGDNVWVRMREGFQMSEVSADLVDRHTRSFASRPDTFRRTLDRSRKYMFYIMNEVEKRGMPTEIALLPMVESAFVPGATSRVGAAGLWQFMPATGRQYGLEQTWWYDGRRDVVESTRAALDYLQNLYNLFGDWSLALAAYNWGEGNVQRAIARTEAAGQVATFDTIKLPNETRNYVPKLLAVRRLVEAPEKYALRLDKLPNKPYFVAVSTGRHMNIDVAARLADMPTSEFKELNPAFNLPVYAHKSGRQMLIPAGRLTKFETNLARWDKPLLTWQVYTPNTEENADALAQRFDMNVAELKSVNGKSGGSFEAGRPVLVAMKDAAPATPVNFSAPSTVAGSLETPLIAAVGNGEAAPAPVVPAQAPATQLASAAPVATAAPAVAPAPATAPAAAPVSVASAASQLDQALGATPAPAPAKPVLASADSAPRRVELSADGRHQVQAGDTLFNISRRYNLSVSELKALNGLDEDTVKLGQLLKVRGQPIVATPVLASADDSGAQSDAIAQLASLRQGADAGGLPRVDYVVQRGDTVFSIARKFGVRHTDIQRWNDADTLSRLQPGQRVRVMSTTGL